MQLFPPNEYPSLCQHRPGHSGDSVILPAVKTPGNKFARINMPAIKTPAIKRPPSNEY